MLQDMSRPTIEMIQSVQYRILGLDEAIVVLESNDTIMTSLGNFYSDVSQELQDSHEELRAFKLKKHLKALHMN